MIKLLIVHRQDLLIVNLALQPCSELLRLRVWLINEYISLIIFVDRLLL
jgi:hypothetical protein